MSFVPGRLLVNRRQSPHERFSGLCCMGLSTNGLDIDTEMRAPESCVPLSPGLARAGVSEGGGTPSGVSAIAV